MQELISRYPALEACRKDIENALCLMVETYKNGGKILVCGNGGSAADSEHIVGELMKGFVLKREVDDERIPENLRSILPVIADDKGVVWIHGIGVAHRTAVTDLSEHIIRIDVRENIC